MDAKNCYCLPWDDGADKIKAGLPEFLLLADKSDDQLPLTTSWVHDWTGEWPYCSEIVNTLGKLGSIYFYYNDEVFII